MLINLISQVGYFALFLDKMNLCQLMLHYHFAVGGISCLNQNATQLTFLKSMKLFKCIDQHKLLPSLVTVTFACSENVIEFMGKCLK